MIYSRESFERCGPNSNSPLTRVSNFVLVWIRREKRKTKIEDNKK